VLHDNTNTQVNANDNKFGKMSFINMELCQADTDPQTKSS